MNNSSQNNQLKPQFTGGPIFQYMYILDMYGVFFKIK